MMRLEGETSNRCYPAETNLSYGSGQFPPPGRVVPPRRFERPTYGLGISKLGLPTTSKIFSNFI